VYRVVRGCPHFATRLQSLFYTFIYITHICGHLLADTASDLTLHSCKAVLCDSGLSYLSL
jgi:hypothetical protein